MKGFNLMKIENAKKQKEQIKVGWDSIWPIPSYTNAER